ncbi:unnamed protein product [Prorocentrum cordatum]|uniref:Mei2-like C-terminal RNA recognition motif domain-containing protein n=1 Tax=Prorocentrum cordatum TaxID=2364126 RepID=A0ABN9Y3S5_9DINO|nr:unnamed protein product [Polarella glacialis]
MPGRRGCTELQCEMGVRLPSLSVKNTFIEVTESEDAVSEGLRRVSSCPSLHSPGDGSNEAACSQEAKARSQPTSPTSEAKNLQDIQNEYMISGFLQHDGGLSGGASTAPHNEGKWHSMAVPMDRLPSVAAGPWWKTSATVRAPLDSKAALFVPGFVPSALRTGSACQQNSHSMEHGLGLGTPRLSENRAGDTTAMMRNVPCSFSRRSLIQLLDNNGFRGKYDFIYMPMDFKRGLCIGYAFVNMTTPDHMQSFIKVFDGFNFRATQYKSSKVCAVSPSKTQGLSANIERYQNSPLMSDEVPDGYKPVLFGTRGRIPFPKPTKVVPHIQHRS